ncbi:hypothetical protein QBC39DRAFT_24830 [Podospora conica]|nr:hypothetical protein QBC39DRAFT_24830 [Schizothecium conicum]
MVKTADMPTTGRYQNASGMRKRVAQPLADRCLGKNGAAASICSIRQPAAGPAWHGLFGAWSMRDLCRRRRCGELSMFLAADKSMSRTRDNIFRDSRQNYISSTFPSAGSGEGIAICHLRTPFSFSFSPVHHLRDANPNRHPPWVEPPQHGLSSFKFRRSTVNGQRPTSMDDVNHHQFSASRAAPFPVPSDVRSRLCTPYVSITDTSAHTVPAWFSRGLGIR